MNVERFVEKIEFNFYIDVPDNQLKALCNYLMTEYSIDSKHRIIAANEGTVRRLSPGIIL